MKTVLHRAGSQLLALLRRRRVDQEMAEEMRLHLDDLTRSYIAQGLSPRDASLAAQKRFGGVAQWEERCRDEHGFARLNQLFRELRASCSSLVRAPAFSVVTIATLAIGMGAAMKLFTLADAALFRPLPYPDAERLVYIGYTDKQTPFQTTRFGAHIQAYRRPDLFSGFAAIQREAVNVVVADEPTLAGSASVLQGSFEVLGIVPRLGRAFLAREYQTGNDHVVVITDRYWRKHFDAAPDILGRQLRINGTPCTVVGVLAEGQMLPREFAWDDIFRPLVDAENSDPTKVFEHPVTLLAHLAPGVSIDVATTELARTDLSPALPQWAKSFFSEQKPKLVAIGDNDRKEIWWVLLLGAALLYIIALLNTANLMLVRVVGRRREFSIRLALGGTRFHIVRLLLIEAALLTSIACILVGGGAPTLFPLFDRWATHAPDLVQRFLWTWRHAAVLCAMALFTAGALVFVPSLRIIGSEIAAGLKEGGASLGESRPIGRIRNGLVLVQVSLAVILLTGTGLMLRTFQKLQRVDLGFDPVGKVYVFVISPRGVELQPAQRLQLFQRLREKLSSLPGVKAVAYGNDPLLAGAFWGTAQLQLEDGKYVPIMGTFVSKEFCDAGGLTLERGRWLSCIPGQVETVINERLAKTRFGDANPIGRSIKLQVAGQEAITVVGVVRDVREAVKSSAGMHLYFPDWMYPPNMSGLLLRLDKDPGPGFEMSVRQAVYKTDPIMITAAVVPVSEMVLNSMASERWAYTLLKAMAASALALAAVGVFSVIAYTVENRRPEFGLRLALGATPGNVFRLVISRGLILAAGGTLVGAGAAFFLTRFMRNMLFDTKPYDWSVYFTTAGVLLLISTSACWLPAMRASKINLARLLREM